MLMKGRKCSPDLGGVGTAMSLQGWEHGTRFPSASESTCPSSQNEVAENCGFVFRKKVPVGLSFCF